MSVYVKFGVWSLEYVFVCGCLRSVTPIVYKIGMCSTYRLCNERIRLRGKVKFEFRRGKKPEKLDSPYCEREEEEI